MKSEHITNKNIEDFKTGNNILTSMMIKAIPNTIIAFISEQKVPEANSIRDYPASVIIPLA